MVRAMPALVIVAVVVAAVWAVTILLGVGAAKLRRDACTYCDGPQAPDGRRHAVGCPAR